MKTDKHQNLPASLFIISLSISFLLSVFYLPPPPSLILFPFYFSISSESSTSQIFNFLDFYSSPFFFLFNIIFSSFPCYNIFSNVFETNVFYSIISPVFLYLFALYYSQFSVGSPFIFTKKGLKIDWKLYMLGQYKSVSSFREY